MSGGVDSSVAAALLTAQGYRCIGVMMRLWAEVASGEGSGNKCCDEESVNDARRVADALGMPFYLINVERPFKEKVVDLFIDGYSDGLTPNPCLACNRHIRFDYLLNYARRLGAHYLATGHYARLRRQADGSVHLLRGVDGHKDQSYVLSMLGQSELNDLLFPIGDLAKDEVRRIAAARGLPIHSKHDSMDLCFVVDDDYRRFLTDWAPDAMSAGEIVDVNGNVLGKHSGLPNYTVGQRRGLGLSGASAPMYVVELEAGRNQLVVGPAEALGRSELLATDVSWTLGRPVDGGSRVQCQIRYTGSPLDCTVYPQQDGCVRVAFDAPARAISPGQGAVFYDGPHCLGGGLIARPDASGETAGETAHPSVQPVLFSG
jgi:tRNA-specific 2-thiouridylase